VLNYTGGVIRNNIIANNRVYPAAGSAPTYGGGGIWVSSVFGTNTKVIENNTIVENSVSGSGGGGFAGRGGGILVAGTTAIVRNNIVRDNSQVTGGQITATLGGTPVVSFTNIQGGYSGVGNIDTVAMLADTSFYLLPGSPCIDAGDSSSAFADPEDPGSSGSALWPALGLVRNDMGAYGGPGSALLGSFPVTSAGDGGGEQVPGTFFLGQNYPNPFNPTTAFSFTIPQSSIVDLTVFDPLGREVASLVNETRAPGTYKVTWDASGQASGVYYYRLRAGDFVEVRKLILLR
jgi:hypothetical protein